MVLFYLFFGHAVQHGGTDFPDWGLNLGSLHWKLRVLTTGPPGKSPTFHFQPDEVLVTQSCPTLCEPMDCSLPGSSVHGILQTRILERVAVPFSVESS